MTHKLANAFHSFFQFFSDAISKSYTFNTDDVDDETERRLIEEYALYSFLIY